MESRLTVHLGRGQGLSAQGWAISPAPAPFLPVPLTAVSLAGPVGNAPRRAPPWTLQLPPAAALPKWGGPGGPGRSRQLGLPEGSGPACAAPVARATNSATFPGQAAGGEVHPRRREGSGQPPAKPLEIWVWQRAQGSQARTCLPGCPPRAKALPGLGRGGGGGSGLTNVSVCAATQKVL